MGSHDHLAADLSGGTRQEEFNSTGGVNEQTPQPQPLPDLTGDVDELVHDFEGIKGAMGPDALRAFHERLGGHITRLQGLQVATQRALLPFNKAQTLRWLNDVAPPEAPQLGANFARAIERANAKVDIAPFTNSEGSYASYNHSKGFVHEITLNTMLGGTRNDTTFFGTFLHENAHGINTKEDPALYFTPWNKKTNVVMHPKAWMRLENIMERIGYAVAAINYALLARAHPELEQELLDLTKDYVVSVADVFKIMERTNSLQELVTETTLIALDKHLERSKGFGRTEADRNYHNAIIGYWNGIVPRYKDKETFTFLRPEPEDYYALGDLGLGINFLGKDGLDPRFENWPALRIDEQEDLDGLCNFNKIPELEDCMTVREYLDTNPVLKAMLKKEPVTISTGSSVFSNSSGAEIVHAPQHH